MIARGIDTTFRAWTAGEGVRWSGLPGRLGWTRADGSCWDEFIRLDPNRDLAAFVADVIDIDADTLSTFTRAHHFGAMHGIVSDRIVDGQAGDRELLEARRSLLVAWTEELARGLGDRREARRVIGVALRDWKRGVDMERRILAEQSSDWEVYGTAVALRLRWVCATAAAMLRSRASNAAAHALETAYDRFMLALQIIDDHFDSDEDHATRGAAFECVRNLELGPRGIAGLLITGAAARAASGHLHSLATWMHQLSALLLQPGE